MSKSDDSTKQPAPKKPWSEQTDMEKSSQIIAGVIVLAVVIGFAIFSSVIGGIKPLTDTTQVQTGTVGGDKTAGAAKTPKELLEQSVKDVLGDKLRETDVQDQVDGGYGVFVRYNASDNLTTKMVKQGIEKAMSDVYIALYHESKQDVRQASVAAYSPLSDGSGNTSDGVVYKSVLEKAEADKINFNADKATLELDIIPGVWKTTLLNVEFRQ